MSKTINIIDLFAGPGGLGEGFSAFKPNAKKEEGFRIRMSVEKETSAHKTLSLRALYRHIRDSKDASHYREYVEGEISRDALEAALVDPWEEVLQETLGGPTALGDDNDVIHKRLHELKKAHKGEPWVVIGGPPCQAYSLVGRARNKGIKGYRPEDDHRHFLYREYLEVLSIIQPEIFVMENVKGILTAAVNGEKIFPIIHDDLKNPSKAIHGNRSRGKEYKIYSFVVSADEDDVLKGSDYIIRTENYGIPQARHRVILLGVSKDIDKEPFPLRSSSRVNVEDVLIGLPPLRSRLSKEPDSPDLWKQAIQKQVKLIVRELKFSGKSDLADRIATTAAKLGSNNPVSSRTRSQKPFSMNLAPELHGWLSDDAPESVLNHESRGHIAADLGRYLFSASWAKFFSSIAHSSPKSENFPKCLAPAHANWNSGNFADRFRVQAKGRPATTVTSHIAKDGHYFIHYDPRQCRSLTVREAARIQTFPDNYLFEGNRTEQYVQVGNAVPPFLARQLAEVVWEIME